MIPSKTLQVPLLDPPAALEASSSFLRTASVLALTVGSSSGGMLLLKYGQARGNGWVAAAGYGMEVAALVLYPVNMYYLPLFRITATWSATTNLTAVLGGYIIFGETPSPSALCGVALLLASVFLVNCKL